MKPRLTMLVFTSAALLAGGHEKGGPAMNDPYVIIAKHYEATGGLVQWQKVQTTYAEGTIVIEGAGLQGTFRQWTEKPLRMRQEIDLGVIKDVSGDNGEQRWHVDHNGQVLIQKDAATLKEREVQREIALYRHLDPAATDFKLSYAGMEKVGDLDCQVVAITNSLNSDTQRVYYDTGQHYLRQSVVIKPDMEQRTVYEDFRATGGLIVPFRETVVIMPIGQKQVLEYSAYEFDRKTDAAQFEPPAVDKKDYQFTSGDRAEDIPIHYLEEHVYLPVTINGREMLWVLDCGASVSVIDSAYAAELGLELAGKAKAMAASGTVDMSYVNLPAYAVRGIAFEGQKIVAMKIRGLFKRAMGFEVGGILGYDFLSRFVTRIDYARERISFYDPDPFVYQGSGSVLDTPLDENRMFNLPATVDKLYAGKWRLDIGASGLDFSYPYAREHGLLEQKGVDAVAAGAGGMFRMKLSRYSSIELAGFTVRDPVIGVPREGRPGAYSDQSVIGNIGNSFLRHLVLYLDYKNQRVILEKGENYAKEFPESKSGFQLIYNANAEIEVMFVAPGTPAEQAGFLAGDILQSINGKRTSDLGGIIGIKEMMRAQAGTIYTITIRRGEETHDMKLTLKELF